MATKTNRVKEVREAKKLSREMLAATAEISYEYVRRLESDEPPTPGLEIARRIAEALNTTVDRLFPVVGRERARA